MTKHQKEIMELLKDKDSYILAYQTRLDIRCVLIFSEKEFPIKDKVIRFDTFVSLVKEKLIERCSKEDKFNYWAGKWKKVR